MSTPFTDAVRRGRERAGLSAFGAGLIAVILIVAATYFAFSKTNPFDRPYQMHALFNDANDIKKRSPVRVAGVEVGQVKRIEPLEDGSGVARVTLQIKDEGLPIKKDAELKIRPRLFLEGNYFVDVQPGSPSAGELEAGDTIPTTQTASPVQFGELLTALQSDTREDLQTLLKEYSDALDKGGAEGFNDGIRHWQEAYRNTSQASDAYLGRERHDLSRVLRGQGKVFGALSEDEDALRELVTQLNTTVAAFAGQEDNLKAAIPELRDVLRVGRPALRSLTSGLPSVRAFARDALPGARSSNRTLDAQIPFVRQARALFEEAELKGLVRDLRPTVPALTRLNKGQTLTLAETRALSSCQNSVLLPFAKEPIPDPDFPGNSGQPWFKQSQRAFVGLAGESRLHDANSAFFRVQAGGGPTTIASTGEAGEKYFAQLGFPLDGVRPISPSKRPGFRPDVPCETQEPPDLNAASGEGDPPVKVTPDAAKQAKLEERIAEEYPKLISHMKRVAEGKPSVDPLALDGRGERSQARKLGLRWTGDGGLVERGEKR